MGSVHPVRRFHALGVRSRPDLRKLSRRGPPCAFVPLPRPCPAAPHRIARPEVGRPSRDASSPGLPCPTTHPRSADPLSADGSLRRPVPRPRFGTSFAAPPPTLPAREAPERPWASPFEACPRRGGTPLGASALLTLPGRPPRRRGGAPAHLQGLRSRGGVRAPPDSRRVRPRCLPGLPPLQSIPPIRPGHRLWSRCRPSRPRAGRRPCPPGPRAFAERMDRPGPFPDCRLSWGLAPSDRHGAPYTVPRSGLMALPHAGPTRKRATPRDPCSFGRSAAKGPWPPTRRRRPSVLDWMPRPIVSACLSESVRPESGRHEESNRGARNSQPRPEFRGVHGCRRFPRV